MLLLDGILALLLTMMALGFARQIGHWQAIRVPVDETGYVLIVTATGTLAVRRLWPLATFGVVVGAVGLYLTLGYPFGPPLLAASIAMLTVAAARGIRQTLLAFGAGVLALVVHMYFESPGAGFIVPPLADAVSGLLWAMSWLLAPAAVGTTWRVIRESRVRSREEEARELLYAERLRIAQEVHDVVGHGLAAINMQAEVALHVLEKRPEHARTALTVIGRTSKEALDELRATLAVFRADDGESGERRPAPGLDQLDALVTRMSSSGLPVTVTVSGERPEVPAAVDLAGYRIVQESLTNVLRHAGRAMATVRIGYRPGQVTIEITDNGAARSDDVPRGGGHGLQGMRERATAVGGTLLAGPRPDGGYAVVAELPLREAR